MVYFLKTYANNRIASVSSDGIIIWRVNNPKRIVLLNGHKGTVNCLEFVNKYILLSGSLDNTVKVKLCELNRYDFFL